MRSPQAHGVFALMPRVDQLIAARARLDDPKATPEDRAGAAEIMIELGTAFDKGRAQRFLRDRRAA
ncbi:hypothetical protein [Pararhodobacter marinus]|uniref:hypothetical protein n=1 Tax=Pararhodobacter marinus TaxID=2184063 RepID=UPI003515122B